MSEFQRFFSNPNRCVGQASQRIRVHPSNANKFQRSTKKRWWRNETKPANCSSSTGRLKFGVSKEISANPKWSPWGTSCSCSLCFSLFFLLLLFLPHFRHRFAKPEFASKKDIKQTAQNIKMSLDAKQQVKIYRIGHKTC